MLAFVPHSKSTKCRPFLNILSIPRFMITLLTYVHTYAMSGIPAGLDFIFCRVEVFPTISMLWRFFHLSMKQVSTVTFYRFIFFPVGAFFWSVQPGSLSPPMQSSFIYNCEGCSPPGFKVIYTKTRSAANNAWAYARDP